MTKKQLLQANVLKSIPFHLACVEEERAEGKITSTWTTAFLYLLKARRSLPSEASFSHCHLAACRTAPTSDFHPQGRPAISVFHQALTGLLAKRRKRKEKNTYMRSYRVFHLYTQPSLSLGRNYKCTLFGTRILRLLNLSLNSHLLIDVPAS